MNQAQTTSLSGSVIGGRYQILEPLGQGGMAHVYLAVDQKTGVQVAVKVMRDDLSSDQEFIKRFEAEARAASSLNHPNIVRVIGFGQDRERRYIVQEYVEGCSLKELIDADGPIPWQTAVPMAIQIGLALEHAHKNGIVHRDIKPHNILINKDHIAKVTDFGIARATTSNTITLTSGVAFGSVHYFSPEQARGTIVGEKSDIYSLGILLYEMVTGQVPFDGDTSVAVAIKHLQEVPPLPSLINATIPRGLDQIIMKCIQKSPDNRYRNVRELVDELDALMIDPNGVFGVVAGVPDRDGQTTAIQAMRPDPNYNKLREIERTINERRRSRHRDTAIVIAIILVAIVFLTSIGVWGWRKLSGTVQTDPNRTYELENYVGREISEVETQLKKDNIKWDKVFEENPTVPAGIIIKQSPGSGVIIKPNSSVVILTVSGGQELKTIPDYAGQTASKAQTELFQTYGFKVETMTENSSIDKGKVIRTIPAAGQKAPQGSTIVVVVSDGMPMVTMPEYAGQPFLKVKEDMLKLKLVLGPIVSISVDPVTGAPVDVPEANRVVIRQSVPAGTQIIAGYVVSLTYGTAQDYFYFLNPTPTPIPFVTMPDLDRMSLSSTRTLLTLQGLTNLTVSYISEESRALPEGQLYVIIQSPATGAQVALTDPVQITVGSMAEYNASKNPTPTPTPSPTPTPTVTPTPTITPPPPTPTTQPSATATSPTTKDKNP